MNDNIYTPNSTQNILDKARAEGKAFIFEGGTQRPFEIQKIVLALDKDTTAGNGNPYKISFPFRSIYVQAATDTSVIVNLHPNSQDSYQSGVPLKLNDSYDLGEQVSSAFVDWSAQAGKTITLFVFVNSIFRSGSNLSLSAGGTSISEGSAFVVSQVTLAAAAATQIFPSNGLRKVGTFENTTGADVWVGGSVVVNTAGNTNLGIRVPAGSLFNWRNSAPLYAYSVGGGNVTMMEET